MLINEGLPNFLVRHAQAALPAGADARRHPRHGVQGRQRRPARVALVQAPQDPRVRGGRGALHRRRTSRTRRSCRSTRSSSGPTCSFVGAPHREYRALELSRTAKPVIDVWNFFGKGALPVVKILVTGSAGFIAGYLVEELLGAGHEVVGLDNYSKYGPVERGVRRQPALPRRRRATPRTSACSRSCWPTATSSSPARRSSAASRSSTSWPTTCSPRTSGSRPRPSTRRSGRTARRGSSKITVVSSSMVYESTTSIPTPEGEQRRCPPPQSTYGFQKLATEYFAQGACEQYGLPYTIVRPFNCVGVGEKRALSDKRGHVGQRQAGDEPRRARPGPEGAQGAGPAAHPRRRQPGPPLHLRRRPGPRHPPGHRVARGAATRTSTSRPPTSTTVLRAGRADLAQDQGRRAAPARLRQAVHLRRAEAGPRRSRRRTRLLGFEATTSLSTRRSTRSSRGSRARSRSGASDGRAPYGELRRELDRLYADRFLDAEREAKARLWRRHLRRVLRPLRAADGTRRSTSAPATATSSTTFAPVAGSPSTSTPTRHGWPRRASRSTCFRSNASARSSSRRRVDLAFASNVFEHLRGPDVAAGGAGQSFARCCGRAGGS